MGTEGSPYQNCVSAANTRKFVQGLPKGFFQLMRIQLFDQENNHAHDMLSVGSVWPTPALLRPLLKYLVQRATSLADMTEYDVTEYSIRHVRHYG
jgi:hypothetical protein